MLYSKALFYHILRGTLDLTISDNSTILSPCLFVQVSIAVRARRVRHTDVLCNFCKGRATGRAGSGTDPLA